MDKLKKNGIAILKRTTEKSYSKLNWFKMSANQYLLLPMQGNGNLLVHSFKHVLWWNPRGYWTVHNLHDVEIDQLAIENPEPIPGTVKHGKAVARLESEADVIKFASIAMGLFDLRGGKKIEK